MLTDAQLTRRVRCAHLLAYLVLVIALLCFALAGYLVVAVHQQWLTTVPITDWSAPDTMSALLGNFIVAHAYLLASGAAVLGILFALLSQVARNQAVHADTDAVLAGLTESVAQAIHIALQSVIITLEDGAKTISAAEDLDRNMQEQRRRLITVHAAVIKELEAFVATFDSTQLTLLRAQITDLERRITAEAQTVAEATAALIALEQDLAEIRVLGPNTKIERERTEARLHAAKTEVEELLEAFGLTDHPSNVRKLRSIEYDQS